MLPCPKIVQGQQQLTPEQEAYAREFAHERIAAQLSTAAIDEQEAERHLREAYRVAELQPPARIRWFDSPLSFVQACAENSLDGRMMYFSDLYASMQGGAKPHEFAYVTAPAVQTSVWASVGGRVSSMWADIVDRWYRPGGVGAFVRASVWDRAWDNVDVEARVRARMAKDRVKARKLAWEAYRMRTETEVSVWKRVAACVLSLVWPGMWDIQVRAFLVDNVWDSIGDSARKSVQAYHNAGDLAYYRFLHEVFEKNDGAIHLAFLNEMVSGYYLGREEAWLVRKPIILERDEAGRFHSDSSMCMQYRDGWGFYAWHGVRASEQIIMHPEQLTRTDWLAESNAEVRRVIQERLGMERFIEMIGGKQIDAGRRGKLIEIDFGTRDPERVAHYVQVQDSSTERQYYLRVPPSITKADEAIAWTFGMNAHDYQPGQET